MELCVHPRDTITFAEFCSVSGPAVALDGYVFGPSVWDAVGHFNFNHHDGVDRFTTRSTCEQVSLALRAGAPLDVPGLVAHVNDDDPDVALSVWLLEHPGLASCPEVAALCTLQGAIDTCGGPAGRSRPADVDALAWVVDPWAAVHGRGLRDAARMAEVIAEVGVRVSEFVAGRGGELAESWGFDVLEERGDVWAVVERHPLARAKVCATGLKVYVSVRDGDDGRRDVTVGLASPFTLFDLSPVWARLNMLEGCPFEDMWGGGNLVGGSPRSAGTRLEVGEVMDAVEAGLGLTVS